MGIYQRNGREGWYMDFIFNGTRVNRYAGKTKTEAKRVEDEIKTKLRLKMLNVSDLKAEGGVLLTIAADEYLEHVKLTLSPRTYEMESEDYKHHIKEFFSKYCLEDIDNSLLLRFQAGQKSKNYANRTVNIHVGLVRKIMKFARKKGYIQNIGDLE
ncbi:MAG: phage integrase SAM-like domain-containing protein [Nitrospirae bacterium]|nr:phage integrase SAM-like domain-containing protein [Nitrospirota bacterium]